MSNTVVALFFSYYLAFMLMQQIVGHKSGAKNIVIHRLSVELMISEQIFKIVALSCYLVFLLTLGGALVPDTNNLPLRIFGVVLMIAGLLVSGWTQRQLGKNWVGGAALHRSHKLVTDGPFRYVRHPMYAGMLLSAIGQCFVALNIWLQLGAVLFICSFLIRIPREEMLLAKKFKHRWIHYSETTNMVVPSIRKG